ncbi:hypothetical protein BV25DRAFT_204793 [Artomyces pyxidatus]|uniref:Uncharacterized protein n=1 Tax=Artomyces pyxidatus TaxID=48021 RepID=A0ACB8TA44_9AGAM|nr:hypothetical protein BV25DRAFT_204793 [Artomyces pyxidatus]
MSISPSTRNPCADAVHFLRSCTGTLAGLIIMVLKFHQVRSVATGPKSSSVLVDNGFRSNVLLCTVIATTRHFFSARAAAASQNRAPVPRTDRSCTEPSRPPRPPLCGVQNVAVSCVAASALHLVSCTFKKSGSGRFYWTPILHGLGALSLNFRACRKHVHL